MDNNTAYFHKSIKRRWNTNKLMAINDGTGNIVEGHHNVANVAVSFFMNLLGSPATYTGLFDIIHLFSNWFPNIKLPLLIWLLRRMRFFLH